MSNKEVLLYKACCANDVQSVENSLKKSLFSKGAEVNTCVHDTILNPEGDYPIHVAARNGSGEIVNLLIASGAQVNVRNARKETPLHIAAMNGNVRVGQLLIGHGANVSDSMNGTDFPLQIALDQGNTDFATMLTDQGVDVVPHRRALLSRAIDNNNPKALKWLVESGYKIEEIDKNRKTILFEAVEKGMLDAARMLIELGADVRRKDQSQRDPLYYAATTGNTPMARLLLENGACINCATEGAETAKHIAVKKHNKEMVALLFSHDNSDATSMLSYARGDNETIKLLVNHGADINQPTMSGGFEPRTALMAAINTKNIPQAKALIELGAHLTYEVSGKKRYIFTEAVKLGDIDLLEFMLANGGDINENNSSPLVQAIQLNNQEMIEFLIRRGALPSNETYTVYNQYASKELLANMLGDVPDSELYPTMLASANQEYKELVFNRYISTFPEQFDLENCGGGKAIINAVLNLRKPDDEAAGELTLSDLLRIYGLAKVNATLITTKSNDQRVVVCYSTLSGDYETTITRVGFDAFTRQDVLTDWH